MSTNPLQRLRSLLEAHTFSDLVSAGTLVTVAQAARQNGYSRQHVYRLVRAGKLTPITRGGSRFYFFPDQLNSLYR